MRISSILVLFSISLIACGGSGAPQGGGESQPDSGASRPSAQPRATPDAAPGVAGSESSTSQPSFEERVFNAYAQRASSIPKRVMDSVLHANMRDPRKVEAEMTKILRRTDTVARATLAAEFNVSVDSLSGIIDRMNREKGGK